MIYRNTLTIVFFLLYSFSLQAQCWDLVWEDNFDGTALSTDNWSHQIGAGGWGNNELQYYTDLSSNVSVNSGVLKITANEESYMGADYTSARIRSINKSDWTYGKMEARIKLPIGQGIWPAFWMMPTNNEYGGWPASGEIDIMEFLGHQPSTSYGTLHYGYNGDHQYNGSSYSLPSGEFSGSFHDFSVEWEADVIRWYVDGILYHTITEADLGSYPWVFDKDFHFILNVAVGGNWPGSPDGSTTFPQTMEIDYVKVYQLLTDVVISGDDFVQPGDEKSYTLPVISGATHIWSVPSGTTILSGQGTNELNLNWGATSGSVTCTVTTDCGTEVIDRPVTVSVNYFENPAFEFDYNNWNTWTYNGASADFTIATDLPQEGVKYAKVNVTAGGSNNWDVQLQRSGFSIETGVDYLLSFYAKSPTAGTQIPVFIIKNQSPWTSYANMTINLTEEWSFYELNFTAAATDEVLLNLDMGNNVAEFHFDNFIFGEASALPVELGAFTAVKTRDENVLLEWLTYSEVNHAYFEVLRKNGNGLFSPIGRLAGQGNTELLTNYRFVDKKAPSGINYYQLRQVDLDGQFSLSAIRSVNLGEEDKVVLFPNPAKNLIQLNGWNGGLLMLYDISGQVILKKSFAKGLLNYELAIEEFPSGCYFFRTRGAE